jgi:hypothetical protein
MKKRSLLHCKNAHSLFAAMQHMTERRGWKRMRRMVRPFTAASLLELVGS